MSLSLSYVIIFTASAIPKLTNGDDLEVERKYFQCMVYSDNQITLSSNLLIRKTAEVSIHSSYHNAKSCAADNIKHLAANSGGNYLPLVHIIVQQSGLIASNKIYLLP